MKKYFKASVALLITAVTFTSCLKDKPVLDPSYSPVVVELGDPSPVADYATTDFPYNTYTQSFSAKLTSTTYNIPIKYQGDGPAPQDVTVTLALNNTIVAKYDSSYLVLPTSAFTIANYTITIPKGAYYVNFPIVVNPTAMGFDHPYGLGITIKSTSVGSVSGNFGTSLYVLRPKNDYEADYTTTGYFFHPTSPRTLSATKSLSTQGVFVCQAPLADLGGSNYYFNFTISGSNLTNWVAAGATPSGTGSGFMTVDYATPFTALSVVPGTSGWVSSTYNNTYDASKQTFYMHYGYNGSPNAYTREAYEKWVRQ